MNRWLRWLLSDWQIKLLGVAIAVALWAYVNGRQTLTITLSVPLEFRNMPRASRLARRPPGSVEVRLEARWDMVQRMTPRTVKAVVDMTKLVTGRYVTVPLTSDHILRPAGVEVLSINPSKLLLEFDSVGRREED